MTTPTPETPSPTGQTNEETTPVLGSPSPVDTEASTGEGRAPRRARWLALLAALILVMVAWIVYDHVRAPEPGPTPPTSSSSTTTGGSPTASTPGQSPAVATVLNYVTLSYAGDWDKACKLETDQATCLKVSAQAPRRPLLSPAQVLKTEDYPATGVAGQAYTGVLVSANYEGATKPALLAYLVNTQGLIAGRETVSSDESTLSLRQILERHIK